MNGVGEALSYILLHTNAIVCDVVEAHAMATNFLWGIWAIHVAKVRLIVGGFDREGLHQLHNSFVADEDLETSYY